MGELTVQQQQHNTMMQALVPRSITEAVTLAETLAKASLVPKHLQGKAGDCLLVVMQAQRWGMDALSVAQCTSVVHGRLCYEGKLVAAVLYSMGAVDGRLTYELEGVGQNATITVTGIPRGGNGDPQTVTGSVKNWRTFGKDQAGNRIDNAWDKIPEDMLVYRGTRQWARRYAPEALLGIYTPDEFDENDAPVQTATATVVQMPQAKPAAAAATQAPKTDDAEFTPAEPQAKPAPDAPPPVRDVTPGIHGLTDSQERILKTRASSAGLSYPELLEKYQRIDVTNLNEVLAQLRGLADARTAEAQG